MRRHSIRNAEINSSASRGPYIFVLLIVLDLAQRDDRLVECVQSANGERLGLSGGDYLNGSQFDLRDL